MPRSRKRKEHKLQIRVDDEFLKALETYASRLEGEQRHNVSAAVRQIVRQKLCERGLLKFS